MTTFAIYESLPVDGTWPNVYLGTPGWISLTVTATEGNMSAGGRLHLDVPGGSGTTFTNISCSHPSVKCEITDGVDADFTCLDDSVTTMECRIQITASTTTTSDSYTAGAWYNDAGGASQADVSIQYGFSVLPDVVIDPSKISLKGLYVDTNTNTVDSDTDTLADTVGGNRYILSNGVMVAKIYVGFSYSGTEAITVRNIMDWLAANAEMRINGDNNSDYGPLGLFGWTIWAADPNDGKYVYDTTVVVPQENENVEQPPANNIWHMPVYLRCKPDATVADNFYLRYIYDKNGTMTIASTLTDSNLKVTATPYNINMASPSFFKLIQHNYYSESGYNIVQLEYDLNNMNNFDTTINHIQDIYYIRNWRDAPHPQVKPRADTKVNSFESGHAAFDATLGDGTMLYPVYGYPNKKGCVVALVERTVSKINFSNKFEVPIDSGEISISSSEWADTALFFEFSNITMDMNSFKGDALLMWQGNHQYIDVYSSRTGAYNHYAGDLESNISTAVFDSLGNCFSIEIELGSEYDAFPDSWSIYSVKPFE